LKLYKITELWKLKKEYNTLNVQINLFIFFVSPQVFLRNGWCLGVLRDYLKRKKKDGEEEDENMFHLFSYKCFRRTQYVTPFV